MYSMTISSLKKKLCVHRPVRWGVRGVRTNRPLSGRGPRGCMRLHCVGRVQVGPITFSQTKHAHEIVRIRTTKPSLYRKRLPIIVQILLTKR